MILAFLGIILQAFPFLITRVLLSSLIQLFVSKQFIERHFPKNIPLGILFSLMGGFCLPVCDCVSIPVFRSLVKKGIPLTSAVIFMTAAPVINPVVILSTYYAFNGNMRIVAVRILLGIFCSVCIGLSFLIREPKEVLLAGEHFGGVNGCSCGCAHSDEHTHEACCSCAADEEHTPVLGKTNTGGKPQNRFVHFLEHARVEFFSVGTYLIVGAAISAVFQVVGGKLPFSTSFSGKAVSLFVMMAFAFLFSLCSSSDAVVARTFMPRFSIGAVLGFLVFGPMMDIKNILMLSGGFTKKVSFRLLISSFIVCYAVLLLCMLCGLEAIL